MSGPSVEELMQYHDDELSSEQAERVGSQLAESARAREVIRGFELVGEAVRAATERRAESAPDLTDAIMERVDAAPPPGRLRAIPGGGGAAPERRGTWVAVAAGALAAAAAVGGLWVAVSGGESPDTALQSRVDRPASAPVESAAGASRGPAADDRAAGSAGPAVSIETVDFGTQPGSIFMVAGQSEVTPVVWLVDEPAADGARMEPL